jgi:hypothetical protein
LRTKSISDGLFVKDHQTKREKIVKIPRLYLIVCLLGTGLLASHAALSETSGLPLANNVQDDNRVSNKPFAEERLAAQDFIENINEARRELTMRQIDLAQQKILMARNLLPLIARATPAQRRLTRVEFGGGLYADDLDQRKSYVPIETQSLENLTRSAGPRWVKNTRSESDAKMIYVSSDLADGRAQAYLEQATKDIAAGNIKETEIQLLKISDQVIKIDDTVPPVIQARDYIALAAIYVRASNFVGARRSLEQVNDFLEKMTTEDIYQTHRSDIISLHKNIEGLQMAFAKLDADQIKTAEINLKKWQQQLAGWACE